MNFSTKIPIITSNSPIDYTSKIVSLGSCFAENMAAKFDYYKFQNTTNPFGIIFNPVSIENLILRAIENRIFTEADIFFHNEQWHCFEVHSDISNEDKVSFLNNLNQTLTDFKKQISEATHIILTYGTSWIYRSKISNEVVANCHKVPQNQFDKEILSIEIIAKSIHNTVVLIHKINPDCNVIFTISPVRHIKDGFVENQQSKAHLISALHFSIINNPCSTYFPSYEIMMDELRDYRFYTEDMLHPNITAINYIWERFVKVTISEKSNPIMEEVSAIQRALSHRAFNPNSESHQNFLNTLNQKIISIQQQFPFLQF